MPNVPIAKFPMEEKTLLIGEPLLNGATRSWSSIFPVGKGAGETWERIRLMFHITTGVAVYTFPVEAGVYAHIQRITLETSDGETLVDVPGTALYIFNRYNDRHCPWHTPVAAGNAQYDAILDIPFGFSFLRKPEDGYLDSGAYSALRLTITTAPFVPAVAGALGVPNAASTQVGTFDLSVIRTKAGFYNNAAVKPLFVPYIKYIGSRVPSNAQQYFDIESANDLALFGFMLNHGTIATAPFVNVAIGTGLTTEADTITGVTFGDNIIPNIVDNKRLESFRHERNRDFDEIFPWAIPVVPNIPTVSLIGKYNHLFVQDGSVYGAYPCGNKSQIRISYTGGGAGTNQADCMVYGFRTKRRIF